MEFDAPDIGALLYSTAEAYSTFFALLRGGRDFGLCYPDGELSYYLAPPSWLDPESCPWASTPGG
jgi:hypothetical protein